MLFFDRILPSKPAPKDQRRAARYAIGASFPLKAVLNVVGCDEFGDPLESSDGEGWNWTGRMVNFSNSGASIQLPSGTAARRGESCVLILSLAGYELKIPSQLVHVRKLSDSVLFGLKFDLTKGNTPDGYRQLLELVAFGASLKPDKPAASEPDATGYLAEHYHGDFESHLTVWRGKAGGPVQWFEFQLAEYRVRGRADTRTLEFSAGSESAHSLPASPAQIEEIHQLFRWVVPNIALAVPADVRKSLQAFAA